MKKLEFWWWAIEKVDFDILCFITKITHSKRILEFWPWTSTYAFLEWWAKTIHTYEYNESYYKQWAETFSGYGDIIRLPKSLLDEQYDLAFVDWPKWIDNMSRIESIKFALSHSPLVILHDAKRKWEMESLDLIRKEWFDIDIIDTPMWMAIISRKE